MHSSKNVNGCPSGFSTCYVKKVHLPQQPRPQMDSFSPPETRLASTATRARPCWHRVWWCVAEVATQVPDWMTTTTPSSCTRCSSTTLETRRDAAGDLQVVLLVDPGDAKAWSTGVWWWAWPRRLLHSSASYLSSFLTLHSFSNLTVSGTFFHNSLIIRIPREKNRNPISNSDFKFRKIKINRYICWKYSHNWSFYDYIFLECVKVRIWKC